MNSSTSRFLIVRHGETDWNSSGLLQGTTDIPLNERGRGQALAAADFFDDKPPRVMVSSPLGRARETAEIIARRHGFGPLQIEPELAERHYGKAEGLPWRTIEERFPGREVPGMEAEETVRERATRALARIAAEHADEREIVVVAHGAIINSLVRSVVGDDAYPGSASNASVTEFALTDGTLSYLGRRVLPEHEPANSGV